MCGESCYLKKRSKIKNKNFRYVICEICEEKE